MSTDEAVTKLQRSTTNRVLDNLDVNEVQWSKASLPTLASLEKIKPFLASDMVQAVTEPDVKETPLEKAKGHGVPVVILPSATVYDVAELFDSMVAPAVHAPRTRSAYFRSWRTFVTFAISMNCLAAVLPASPELLKAFIVAMITVGLKSGTILATLSAVNFRHAAYGFAPPVSAEMLRSWSKAVKRCLGQPRAEKFRIMPCHLQLVLRLTHGTLLQLRDACIFILGTVCSLRCGEIPDLDVCDLMFDIDGPGTLALRIKWRKNDIFRKGLWPRIGSALNKALCVITLLRTWLRRAGLKVQPGCTKPTHPGSPCEACGRLFPKTTAWGKRVQRPTEKNHGVTRAHVTSAVRNCLLRIGVTPQGYSPISMRRGGVSAAVCAGVPADLRMLQTGHTSDAWSHYAVLSERSELYRCWDAFGL